MAEPVQLYICYAEENKNALSRLEKQLTSLIRTEKIQLWHRDKLLGGDYKDQNITTQLARARIILMLVSADLFNEHYNSYEVQRAFQLYKEQEIRLIPIIVGFCNWQEDQTLRGLVPLPRTGNPAQNDKDWSSVVKEIIPIVTQMQAEQAQKEPTPVEKSSGPKPRKPRKSAEAKSQPLAGAALTTSAPTTNRPRRSRSLPAPTPSQPALPDHTLPAAEEPQPRTIEARTATSTFGQDHDQIQQDMLKIVVSILIWEPSRSTHDPIASERRAIHQALLALHHRSILGSTLPIPAGASLQDCEIAQVNTSDMTFVIVEPEILPMLELHSFYRITDEGFLNKTYCYYPKNEDVSGQLDKDLHSLKKLDYYREAEIGDCHIRTEVLDWVQTKRVFMYRNRQSSRRGR